MVVRSKSRLLLFAAGFVVSMAGASAYADYSPTVFQITATNDHGTATYAASFGDGYFDPSNNNYDWALPQAVTLMSRDGIPIARLGNAVVHCEGDPVVSLTFSVFAGDLNTTFTISSPVMTLANPLTAEGRASSGITLSDLDGNGVTYTPTDNGVGGYLAQYNGAAPTGTTFADIQATPFGTPDSGGTIGRAEAFPGGGAFAPIANPVSDMSTRFRFVLTANDSASGTSVFETRGVPAPGALTLLGVGGLIAARRRR